LGLACVCPVPSCKDKLILALTKDREIKHLHPFWVEGGAYDKIYEAQTTEEKAYFPVQVRRVSSRASRPLAQLRRPVESINLAHVHLPPAPLDTQLANELVDPRTCQRAFERLAAPKFWEDVSVVYACDYTRELSLSLKVATLCTFTRVRAYRASLARTCV
jgi:hypothetical protein